MKLAIIVGLALLVAWMLSAFAPSSSSSGNVLSDYGSNNLLDAFTEAQAEFEGFYIPGSLAARTNNPGNIGTYGGKVGTYSDVGSGFQALSDYDTNLAQQNPGWSITQFITYYLTGDPNGTPGPGQNPQAYSDYVSNKIGVSGDTPIGSLFG